jgi:tRNA dimethylallyltransferase
MVLPDTRYTVAEFQADASALIDTMHAAHTIPMIVGGTGQYVTSLLEGWQIPQVEPNSELRADLEAYAEEHGWQGLLERLRALDPVYADQVDAKNLRRVIRAIEVCVETGRPYSDFRQKHPPAYTTLEIVLTMERSALYDRADQRIDQMIEAGLVAEVESLIERGYDWHLPSMTSLGYLQIGQYLRGEVTLDEALAAMRFATHDFIRRQYTWFRKYNRDAHWIEIDSTDLATILDFVSQWWKTLRQM